MRVLILLSMVVLATAASGHDLWLERTGEVCALCYGHHSSSGHEGEDRVAYSPDIVVRVAAFDERALPVAVARSDTFPVRILGDCAVTYVLTSTGIWTKTPYGTKNLPRRETEMPIASWRSFESVKRVDRWSDALAKPLTDGLELVPQADPLRLGEGDKLRLVVTLRGNPVEGAIVSVDDKPRGTTGSDGKINVRLRRRGFQAIQASLREPSEEVDIDEVVHTTHLNFEIGRQP